MPIGKWLRGPLREWAEALLAKDSIEQSGLLAASPIRERWAEHLSGKRNWQYPLWTALSFLAWQQEILSAEKITTRSVFTSQSASLSGEFNLLQI